jgi:hypothetical protein
VQRVIKIRLKSTSNILKGKERAHSSGSLSDSMFQNSTRKGADSGSLGDTCVQG